MPVAVGVWVGSWWGTSEAWPSAALVVSVPVLAAAVFLIRWQAAGRRVGWHLLALAVMTLVAFSCGLMRLWSLEHSPLAELGRDRGYVGALVVVKSDPVHYAAVGTRPEFVAVQAEARQVTARGDVLSARVPIRLTATSHTAARLGTVTVGQRLAVSGLLSPREPGDPVAASLRLVDDPLVVARPGLVDRSTNRFRAAVRDAMRWAPADQRHLLPSLVVGDTTGVDDRLQEAFRATGLTHLMAVSGANLALTLAWIMGLARLSGLRGRVLNVLALAGVTGFVVVCRGEPSVLRAAAMGLVTLAAGGRHASAGRGVRHLAAAAVAVLLIDPWLARSVGFALSVAATGGIIWWASSWTRRSGGRTPPWVGPVVFVPLAAQLATQPLVTFISGGVSTVGILANALAAPFVAPVTVLGLSAAVLHLLSPPLGAVVGWLAGACLQPIIWIATLLAATPGAVYPWPASPVGIGVLAAGCLLLGALVPRLVARPLIASVVLGVLLVAPWIRPRPLGWPGSWDVVFCDVGQGDATLVRAGPGTAVLIDTGPADERAAQCLHDVGVTRVPLLVLTHLHADHAGGLGSVLAALDVTEIWLAPGAGPAADARRIEGLAAASGTVVAAAPVGASLQVGVARVEVLFGGASGGDPADGEGESSAENNASVALRASVGDLSVVVAGDAELEEQQLMDERGIDVRATVWKMPHHGSSRQSTELWRASGARIAVVSAGLDNEYGHPAAASLRLAAQLGMAIVRTDRQGAVALRGMGAAVDVRTQRGPGP